MTAKTNGWIRRSSFKCKEKQRMSKKKLRVSDGEGQTCCWGPKKSMKLREFNKVDESVCVARKLVVIKKTIGKKSHGVVVGPKQKTSRGRANVHAERTILVCGRFRNIAPVPTEIRRISALGAKSFLGKNRWVGLRTTRFLLRFTLKKI